MLKKISKIILTTVLLLTILSGCSTENEKYVCNIEVSNANVSYELSGNNNKLSTVTILFNATVEEQGFSDEEYEDFKTIALEWAKDYDKSGMNVTYTFNDDYTYSSITTFDFSIVNYDDFKEMNVNDYNNDFEIDYTIQYLEDQGYTCTKQ